MSNAWKVKPIWWQFKRTIYKIMVATSNKLFGKEATQRVPIVRLANKMWLSLVEAVSPTRRKQARFERDNPGLPWFVPAAIPVVESILEPNFVGFEWGAGRSTVWFAQRVAHITSVEGRKKWFSDLVGRVEKAQLESKVTLVLAEVTSEHNFVAEEIERYAGTINEIADTEFDFVVVDGHFREACLEQAAKKTRKGGFLIVDNSEIVPQLILDRIAASSVRRWNNGIWETTIIQVR